MYKNQLQELAQRSCFTLPSYACTREGPDHAPRFRACVTFNGETFHGPSNCTTLRQAEHAAAEVALAHLSLHGPARSLTAKFLDETGVYKNLLQETAHRAGLKLPVYTTVRSGPGHAPSFASTVEVAGVSFAGDVAKTKKLAEKHAAMAAWAALKRMHDGGGGGSLVSHSAEEQEQVVVAKVLARLKTEANSAAPARQGDLEQGKKNGLYHQPLYKRRPLNGANEASSSPLCSTPQLKWSFSVPPTVAMRKILPPASPQLFRHAAEKDDKDSCHGLNFPDTKNHPKAAGAVEIAGVRKLVDELMLKNTLCKAETTMCSPAESTYKNFDPPKRYTDKWIPRAGPECRPPLTPATPALDLASALQAMGIPRTVAAGRFAQPPAIAPAVSMRSVIPVCSAPPQRKPEMMKPEPAPAAPESKEEISAPPSSNQV